MLDLVLEIVAASSAPLSRATSCPLSTYFSAAERALSELDDFANSSNSPLPFCLM